MVAKWYPVFGSIIIFHIFTIFSILLVAVLIFDFRSLSLGRSIGWLQQNWAHLGAGRWHVFDMLDKVNCALSSWVELICDRQMNGLFPSGCHTDRRKWWCHLNVEFLRLPRDNSMCIWAGTPKCKLFLLIPNVCKFMLLGWQRHCEWYAFSIVLYNWNFHFIVTVVKYSSCWISVTFPAAPKPVMGLRHQSWKIRCLLERVLACLLKALTVFSLCRNALTEGRVESGRSR